MTVLTLGSFGAPTLGKVLAWLRWLRIEVQVSTLRIGAPRDRVVLASVFVSRLLF